VRSCFACGLWMLSPRPTRTDLPNAYPPGYHRTQPITRRTAEGERGSLLDVGCGTGNYMLLAESQGWRVVGIEMSEEAARIARSRGLEVCVGDVLEAPFPRERFDRVRCSHVLEHVTDPLLLLRHLRDVVNDTGVIEVTVPNRRSALSKIFRRFWYQLDLPRHLYHFAPTDIAALAKESGLCLRTVRHTASATGLLGSIDCLTAGAPLIPATRLRSVNWLRRLARVVTWPLARLHLADTVEYELVPKK
jgi:SAM-dependent methyltransferase